MRKVRAHGDPNEKLAASLAVLQDLQKSGRRVFQSQELTCVHRERLLRSGFLQEVMKGWLISSSPGAREGDSTRGTYTSGNSARVIVPNASARNGTCHQNSRCSSMLRNP